MKKPLQAAFICLVVIGALISGGCATTTVSHQTNIPAQVISRVNPEYPFEMRRAGVGGTVLVRFIVDTDGIPQDIRVTKSSSKEFEGPAIAAVAKWRFKPALRDGQPVPCPMAIPFVFAIAAK